MLLNILLNEPPFRIITFKIASSLVCHLAFNKKRECSLTNKDLKMLEAAYN